MKKDLSMEARLLLAFVLMGLVLFVTPYFYKPATAPAPGTKGISSSKTTDPKTAAAAPSNPEPGEKPISTAPPQQAAAELPGQIHDEKEETIVVDTDLCRVEFSNRGAVVRKWVLKDFRDHNGKQLDLVNEAALAKVAPPFSIVFKGQTPATDPNNQLFKVDRSADGLSLSFEYSDGRGDVKKTFRFGQKSYLTQITSQVTENGVQLPHLLAWRGGFGDETIANPAAIQQTLYYDSKLEKKAVKDAKNGPVSVSGQFSFAGLEDSYFAGVFLPAGRSIELTTFADTVASNGKEEPRIGAGVGGDGYNSFDLYVGPKDTDILKRVNPKLEQVVDWGWFEIIAKPLFEVLKWLASHLNNNYGWAIVVATIAINLLLFPLRLSSMKSSKKMQSLQPQITAINAKYKGLSLSDPRKAEQNQEIMDLYKKEGVNPAGGCLPLLLQMPFLFAFYKVLSVCIQMRGAHWLWVSDLSQPESLPIHLLPVILVITQFMTQRMTPSPGMDPAQQKMMMFMPLVFGYMFYFQSAGLVLYWLTSNLVGIAQQWFLNRGTPKPQVVDVKPIPKKKTRK